MLVGKKPCRMEVPEMNSCTHEKPCQHTDWTRKDVEELNKGRDRKDWEVPNWYILGAESKWKAMGRVK